MKLDDRDITCETDYTPLSNAELLAAVEQHVAIMYTSPIIDFDLEWIIGPARALMARAEAAEGDNLALSKEPIELKERLDAMESIAQHDQQQLIEMAARVAELESQLAAQQWRPGSETPNAIDTYLVYRAAPPQNEPWRYDFAVWEDDGWDTEGFTHYRPLPPAPQETE